MSSPSPSEPGDGHLRVDWDAPLRATWLLVAVLVAVHVITGLWVYSKDTGTLWADLIADRPRNVRVAVGGQHQRLIDEGETWRWASSVFLHTGAGHLAVNASGLWVLGRMMEPWIGPIRWLGVFVLGGIAGSITSSVVGVTQSDGASGGGFALIGALWVLGWRVRDRLDDHDRWLMGPVLTGFLIANLALGLALPFVDAAAHAGGLILGVLAGFALPRPEPAR